MRNQRRIPRGGGGQGGTINTKQERFDGSHEASPETIKKQG